MVRETIGQLDRLFNARSVAFIGASASPTKWGYRVVERALKSGYRGGMYPVNPNGQEVLGLKAYKTVDEIPHEVDLAVFTLPARHMPQAMEACVRKGIRAGVIISADFAETGEKGKALQEATVNAARAGGLRFVGPNGMGIWTAESRLNIALEPDPSPGHIAFISQSGTYGGSLARIAWAKGYGLRAFVSLGNQADVTAGELIEYLGSDPKTKVIVLYLEGIQDGRDFFDRVRRVTPSKPVLVYKGGRSETGWRATLSHTASVAGSDAIFDAMCHQAGIIRVDEVEHLFVMAEALLHQPLPKGNRVGIIGSGGQGVVSVDACAALGLEVPPLEREAGLAMKTILPPHAPVPSNPVDFAGGSRTALDEAMIAEKLAVLDYIDGIISNVPVSPFQAKSAGTVAKLGIDGAELLARIPERYGKPVVTMKFRELGNDLIENILKSAGIPMYQTPEDCARAMSALVGYARIRSRGGMSGTRGR